MLRCYWKELVSRGFIYFTCCEASVRQSSSRMWQAFRRRGKLYLVFEFVEKSMLDILEACYAGYVLHEA